MRIEIEQLRIQQRQSQRLLAALVSNEASEQVLDQLRNGESLENIIERLGISSRHTSVSGENITTYTRDCDQQILGRALKQSRSIGSSPLQSSTFSGVEESSLPPPNQQGPRPWPVWGSVSSNGLAQDQSDGMMNWNDVSGQALNPSLSYPLIGTWNEHLGGSAVLYSRGQGQETILGDDFGFAQQPNSQNHNYNQSWTNVTSDGAFVEHLMTLYFCWEYPTFASLSKEHFLEDFRNGIRKHCSSLLVNALLALGCRFSTMPQARKDPQNRHTSGDHFFEEALRLLRLETDRHKLTTIQALGLMSIREASCGRSSESLFYSGQSMRLAIEMGLHHEQDVGSDGSEEADIEHAVRSATFWGAFSLDQ
jgi:Fungal specific transcription factor domain